jgi:indole-3-glycerol phosphate synthase
MSDKLTEIVAAKREHVAALKRIISLEELERRVAAASPPRGFARSLAQSAASGRFALIAEMKRRSPSGGEIRPGFDPAEIARDYHAAGAACLSVLTDEPFFGGLDADIVAARSAVPLPALRKDFMIDPWQIAESRAFGADCVLLIVAALDDALMGGLAAEAKRLGMDALVEIHDEAELDRALALDARFIGINNRNLKTLRTDLETFERLSPRVPADCLLVAESGLRTTADLQRMADAGAGAFLVGESLLRQPDLVAATRALLGTARR